MYAFFIVMLILLAFIILAGVVILGFLMLITKKVSDQIGETEERLTVEEIDYLHDLKDNS